MRPGLMSSKYCIKYIFETKVNNIKLRFSLLKIICIFSALAMQVDKHSVAYLSYHGGIRSMMSASVVRDTGKKIFILHIKLKT